MLLAETACILLGLLPLAAGYFQFHFPQVAIACLVIGLLWLVTQGRRWSWVAGFGLFVFVCAAGAGVWIGLSPLWMGLSVLGSISAWDLADFFRRLQNAAPEEDLRQIKTAHLARLGVLDGVSLVLILVVMLVHLHISFGWMFVLALAAILGIVQVVRRYRS